MVDQAALKVDEEIKGSSNDAKSQKNAFNRDQSRTNLSRSNIGA